MNIVINIILAAQMLSAIAMIGLILVQHGKGADMGAAFGSGSSGSLFGASGSANFLSRTTSVLAGVFFVSTMALTYFGSLHLSGTDSATTVPGFAAPVSAPEIPGSGDPGAVVAPAVPGASATVSAVPGAVSSVRPPDASK